MSRKKLPFSFRATEVFSRGAAAIADAVRVTPGAALNCILVEGKRGKPLVCNDGVTIAKEFKLEDPTENLGARMIRQAAERTGEAVGGGTSTSTVLAEALYAEGVRNVTAAASAVDLKRGMKRGLLVPEVPFPGPPTAGGTCPRLSL